MRPFKHLNAQSLETAVSTLAAHEGRASAIAGGTDLLGAMKDGIHPTHPQVLVNLKTIPDLAYIKEDASGVHIGALTRLSTIETHPALKEKYGALAEAARLVASPQIRRMGTVGGNICQEPRCWYYRYPENGFHCTRKDGKLCNALTGENRYHSIFGAVRVDTTPCSASCPASVEIAAYLGMVRSGDLDAAARLLLETNPLPAITGRVCPHFCEQDCNRGEYDEAVSIRSVERFLGDYILDRASEFLSPGAETGHRVAIVGAGPAGLSAAYYLRKRGHRVAVYDRLPEPGGMLAYAIPAYRLPRDVVRRATGALADMGVEFRPGVVVGDNVAIEDLKEGFDSIFLATGAWRQPSIGLEGEELTRSGLEFLTNVAMGLKEAPGQRVVVIGGGSVAADVSITARRLGAGHVTMVCLECREEMPAFAEELERLVEEGIEVLPSWGPARVMQEGGRVTGLEMVRCVSVFDDSKRFAPRFEECTRETIDADQIIMAVGQRADLSSLGSKSPVQVQSGLIAVAADTQATSVAGLFAGGDVVSARGTVVGAIAAGRTAAAGIDRYLRGVDVRDEHAGGATSRALISFSRECLRPTDRVRTATLAVPERRIDLEDAPGIVAEEVEIEANRCFNCGCVAVSPSDIGPALIALDAEIKTTRRTVPAEEFFAVEPAASTILEPGELVTEIQIPPPRPGSRQVYLKFRLRNAIDFPIVDVAVVVSRKNGSVDEARIVLGAVAPIPLRMRHVEGYLQGKMIDEQVAVAAAAMAVEAAIPLTRNAYKIQITRALVRRAILAAAG